MALTPTSIGSVIGVRNSGLINSPSRDTFVSASTACFPSKGLPSPP